MIAPFSCTSALYWDFEKKTGGQPWFTYNNQYVGTTDTNSQFCSANSAMAGPF